MAIQTKIVECVPNFSEGRDKAKIEQIVQPFRETKGVKLLDYSNDEDHNRCVVTVMGEPEAVRKSVLAAVEVAVKVIDMTKHEGQHPRMGAVDVIPFIPIRNMEMEEAIELSKEVGKEIGERIGVPVFLYEKSATAPHRENLAKIRKGQFEGMAEKIHEDEWHPDFGPADIHPTAGVVAVADAIAKKVRHIGGGLRFCKAMGVELTDRHIVQVSMNLTDYTKTAVYRAHEMVRMEARRYGVEIVGAEVIGLVPMKALIDCAEYYLGIENFCETQILELRMME